MTNGSYLNKSSTVWGTGANYPCCPPRVGSTGHNQFVFASSVEGIQNQCLPHLIKLWIIAFARIKMTCTKMNLYISMQLHGLLTYTVMWPELIVQSYHKESIPAVCTPHWHLCCPRSHHRWCPNHRSHTPLVFHMVWHNCHHHWQDAVSQ